MSRRLHRAAVVLAAVQELQAVRGRLAKVTPDDLERALAVLGLDLVDRPRTDPEFLERACPACQQPLAPSDTHWSLFTGPAGAYVCPVELKP